MSLLFLLDRFPGLGGIEGATCVLANALAWRGYEVHIVSRTQERLDMLSTLDPSITTHKLPAKEWAENRSFLEGLCEHVGAQVIINQESYSRSADLLASIDRSAVKVITVEHNTPDAMSRLFVAHLNGERLTSSPRSWVKRAIRPLLIARMKRRERAAHRKYLSVSDRYALLSPGFVPVLEGIVGSPVKDRVVCIPNAVVMPSQTPSQRREREVIYAGRLVHAQKRVDRLLRIWAKIESSRQDWRLTVLGDGPDRGALEQLSRELGLHRVHFAGYQADPTQFYRRASVLALTSEVEGFPLVLLEAMAHGVVPVLFDSFAAASDVVEPQRSGVLVTPFDEGAYAAALSRLMDDQAGREEMSRSALAKAQEFTVFKVTDRWVDLLERMRFAA